MFKIVIEKVIYKLAHVSPTEQNMHSGIEPFNSLRGLVYRKLDILDLECVYVWRNTISADWKHIFIVSMVTAFKKRLHYNV